VKRYFNACATSALMTLSVCLPHGAFACSRALLQHTLGKRFDVMVSDRGKPIAGIEVKLFRVVGAELGYDRETRSVSSNAEGLASFSGVEPGSYRVVATHGAVGGEEADLKIVARESVETRLELRWPAGHIFLVQVAAGKFRIGETRESLSGAEVSLTEALPNRLADTTMTDQEGKFEFRGARPALYVLSIKQSTRDGGYPRAFKDIVLEFLHIQDGSTGKGDAQDVNGQILVEVEPGAMDRNLPAMGLAMTDCGLETYLSLDRSQADH
jgi:hypothetical protein